MADDGLVMEENASLLKQVAGGVALLALDLGLFLLPAHLDWLPEWAQDVTAYGGLALSVLVAWLLLRGRD